MTKPKWISHLTIPFTYWSSACVVSRLKKPTMLTSRKPARKRRSIAAVRGTRPFAGRPSRSIVQTPRKLSEVMSASETWPRKFQCTFSKVAQKTAARKKNWTSGLSRTSAATGSTAAPPAPRPAPPATAPAAARGSGSRCRADRPSSARATRGSPRGCPSRPPARRRSRRRFRGRAVRRHRGEDRALGREVLEDLPGGNDRASAVCLGQEQQVGLRVALELQRFAVRQVRKQLEPVAQPERRGPLLVGGPESAGEPGDHVIEPGRGECAEKRPRVALAEE